MVAAASPRYEHCGRLPASYPAKLITRRHLCEQEDDVMQKRFLIDGSLKSNWFTVPFALAIIALGIAIFMKLPLEPRDYPGYLIVTFGIAVFFACVSAVSALRIVAKRRWLEVENDGFAIVNKGARKTYSDKDVMSLAHFVTRNYFNGKFTAITHSLTLWLPGQSGFETVSMNCRAKVGKLDEFGQFVDRVWTALVTRMKAYMDEGKPVVGEGWKLDKNALTARSAEGEELVIPMADIAAVNTVDQNVCVWRKGEDLPCWKVKQKTVNASMLNKLLDDIIQARGAYQEPGLGRILFERKIMTLTASIICYLLVLVGFIFAVGLSFITLMIGIPIGIGSLAGGVATWICRKDVLRCHSRAVFLRRWGRERHLMYEDVGSFSYSATRMYHNGIYTGTTLSMKFLPRNPATAKKISYSTTLSVIDDGLELLREHVSGVIAAQMGKLLAQDGSVPWTQNMRFLRDGLEYRATGFVRRSDPKVVPYTEITNFTVQDGTFHLWIKGSEKSVMHEAMSVMNFFPGYALLASMFRKK
jgi:hypothetical protein